VSHNRTGKVYLAVVAVRDITAGTEVTFDRGTASYVGCMNAVLRCRLSNQQQQQQQQQQKKLKSSKIQTEQQQQQQLAAEAAAERKDLPVCPVPAGDDVPAGKLHKSLMSQLLAALATCRKLPASNAHRNALDKLLQQAVTLAHEAVVVASASAPAMQQLSPRERNEQQQQQSGRVSPAMSLQLSPRQTASMQQQQQVPGKVSAAVQQLLSGGAPAAKPEAAAAAADGHRNLAAAESCNLSGASSTLSAPRTPTFGGFLEDAVAAEAARQQQQQQGNGASRTPTPVAGAAAATVFATAAGAAAAAAAAEDDERLFGIQLTGFGSAESFESVAAAAVRPSRWSQSLSAAVEVPEEWQQGDAEADMQYCHEQQQQQQQQGSARARISLLDDCCAQQQQHQQQGLAEFAGDGGECGDVCAGSVQANIQPLVRQLIR
jgi:hypothetical protein